MAAKAKKSDKGAAGGVHGHIRARMEYLHKAAIHLQSHLKPKTTSTTSAMDNEMNDVEKGENEVRQVKQSIRAITSRQYINQMRTIAQKTQQRLPQETKRGFCKRCDLLLVPGETCTEEIQNESKGRRKPWADVLVVRCKACQTVKRFPQNRKRSLKLALRKKDEAVTEADGGEG